MFHSKGCSVLRWQARSRDLMVIQVQVPVPQTHCQYIVTYVYRIQVHAQNNEKIQRPTKKTIASVRGALCLALMLLLETGTAARSSDLIRCHGMYHKDSRLSWFLVSGIISARVEQRGPLELRTSVREAARNRFHW